VNALARHFAHHRIAWSRAVVAVILAVILFSPPGRLSGLSRLPEWLADLCEVFGYALVVAATLWRIWCALFIAGTKNGELAAEGPYSTVRNPLYIGNFLGAVGLGFAVQQPLLAIVVGILFALTYPAVIAEEEANLTRIFGERYREYCARVPRWLPDWSLYREPALVTVPPQQIRKAILDAMWFLWAFGLWKLIEILHNEQLLPTLF
jgi:protein-S-isoprenylcysteine O-methyltransferase Ste14